MCKRILLTSHADRFTRVLCQRIKIMLNIRIDTRTLLKMSKSSRCLTQFYVEKYILFQTLKKRKEIPQQSISLIQPVVAGQKNMLPTSTESMRPCSSFFWWGKSPSPTGKQPNVWIDRSFIWIVNRDSQGDRKRGCLVVEVIWLIGKSTIICYDQVKKSK